MNTYARQQQPSGQPSVPETSGDSFEHENLTLVFGVNGGYELPSRSGQFMPHPFEVNECLHACFDVQFFHVRRLMTLSQHFDAERSKARSPRNVLASVALGNLQMPHRGARHTGCRGARESGSRDNSQFCRT